MKRGLHFFGGKGNFFHFIMSRFDQLIKNFFSKVKSPVRGEIEQGKEREWVARKIRHFSSLLKRRKVFRKSELCRMTETSQIDENRSSKSHRLRFNVPRTCQPVYIFIGTHRHRCIIRNSMKYILYNTCAIRCINYKAASRQRTIFFELFESYFHFYKVRINFLMPPVVVQSDFPS